MPKQSQVHVDRPLENISVAYKNETLIGDMLSPRVRVTNESNQYFIYAKDFAFDIPETLRAIGSPSNKATFNMSTASYTLEEHSLHDDVPDRLRENTDRPANLDVDVTESLTEKIMLRREYDLASFAQTKANFANNQSLSAALQWSANTTASNPITMVDTGATAILQSSGKPANVLVVDRTAFVALKEHTSFVERLKYTSSDSVAKEIIAKLLNLQSLLVGEAVYNTADEGLTPSNSFIWNDTAVLAHVPTRPALKTPSGFYTFTKTNERGNTSEVMRWREPNIKGDRIEVSITYANKSVASDCVYLFVDTVA